MGPIRAWPCGRGWKKFAARADKAVFEPDQVRDAVCLALEADWRQEVAAHIAAIRSILGDSEPALPFKDLTTRELEGLKRLNPGKSLWHAVIDGVIQAVLGGQTGADALLTGGTEALLDRAARGARQVEEHWRRKTSEARTERMRARLMDGIARAPIGDCVRGLLGLQSSSPTDHAARHDGVDDGVRLP